MIITIISVTHAVAFFAQGTHWAVAVTQLVLQTAGGNLSSCITDDQHFSCSPRHRFASP
jgi:hypothetical protein